MGHKEFHIDARYKLFGKMYHPFALVENLNPFLKTHRDAIVASTGSEPARYHELDSLGTFASDMAGNKFIPLFAQLVIPDGVGTPPFPLAVFIHGQALSYFGLDGNALDDEVRGYRGYRYLQYYLADRGIASISVNVNIANHLGGPAHHDFQQHDRIQIAFLHLAMLFQLVQAPVTTHQPIQFQKHDGTLVPLQDALAIVPPFSAGSQESLLNVLKNAIAGKLSFTNFGFMGHSRGGTAVQFLQRYFSPRVGVAPTDYATPSSPSGFTDIPLPSGPYTAHTSFTAEAVRIHNHQYHAILDLATLIGNPTMDHLKAVVSLQPHQQKTDLNHPNTFFLIIASSHDSDTQEKAFNSYELVNGPKAMIFVHGASHGRFNSIWRHLSYIRPAINKDVLCQSPIRMLSNAGHEAVGKATICNAFLAAQLGQNYRYRFFTGEFLADAIRTGLERAWKFPFPFSSPPAFESLDGAAITATNLATTTAVAPVAVPNLVNRLVGGHRNYANFLGINSFTRPIAQALAIRIPITAANHLVARTHFSFRYALEYDAENSTARSRAKLHNYTLRLKNGANVLGDPITGDQVRSLIFAAYPTKQFNENTSLCEPDSRIILQTAEVPLSQFFRNGQPLTDLNQVTAIEITLQATAGAAGDEVYFLVDYLLTTRTLPTVPSGFALP